MLDAVKEALALATVSSAEAYPRMTMWRTPFYGMKVKHAFLGFERFVFQI